MIKPENTEKERLLKILCRTWSLESKDFILYLTVLVGDETSLALIFGQPQTDTYSLPQAGSFNLPDINHTVCWHSPAWLLTLHFSSLLSVPPPTSHKQELWKQGSGRGENEQDLKEKEQPRFF